MNRATHNQKWENHCVTLPCFVMCDTDAPISQCHTKRAGYVWHDSFDVCFRTCPLTHSYGQHNSCMNAPYSNSWYGIFKCIICRGTFKWVICHITHLNVPHRRCHIWMCRTVISRNWMCHTDIQRIWICSTGISRIWMCCTDIYNACECDALQHTATRHITHLNGPHCHITQLNVLHCNTLQHDMSRIWMCGRFKGVICHVHTCDKRQTHPKKGNQQKKSASFIGVAIAFDANSYVWHDSIMCMKKETCKNRATPPRGDGHWGKKEKNKNSWYSVQGPGRMAQTPQAGTGDSVSRIRRYHCSTVINYDSYFLVGEQFCFQLLFTT